MLNIQFIYICELICIDLMYLHERNSYHRIITFYLIIRTAFWFIWIITKSITMRMQTVKLSIYFPYFSLKYILYSCLNSVELWLISSLYCKTRRRKWYDNNIREEKIIRDVSYPFCLCSRFVFWQIIRTWHIAGKNDTIIKQRSSFPNVNILLFSPFFHRHDLFETSKFVKKSMICWKIVCLHYKFSFNRKIVVDIAMIFRINFCTIVFSL